MPAIYMDLKFPLVCLSHKQNFYLLSFSLWSLIVTCSSLLWQFLTVCSNSLCFLCHFFPISWVSRLFLWMFMIFPCVFFFCYLLHTLNLLHCKFFWGDRAYMNTLLSDLWVSAQPCWLSEHNLCYSMCLSVQELKSQFLCS